MRLRHGSTPLRVAMTVAALLSGPAQAETPNASPPEGTAMTRIQLIIGDETLSATLDDTEEAR